MRQLWILGSFLLLLLPLFSSCNNTYKTLFVASQKVDCMGVAPQKCLQIRESSSQNWENFYGNIQNFDYQEGYHYKVKVQVTERENPPQDASALVYTLVEILSKEKASQEDNQTVESSLKSVIYEASTRGRFLQIKVFPKQIEVFNAQGVTEPILQEISKEEWENIVAAVNNIELQTINTLSPPSNDRARDAALAAQVTIKNDQGVYNSSIFDHKNPPAALEKLVNQVFSITEGVD